MRFFEESRLTVISPVYRNEDTLEELARRIGTAANAVFGSYELVFVNDGSPDGSREVLRRLAEADKNVRAITLVRNFGQHVALMVGLRHARGDYIMFIDADLEESPEDLAAFAAKMKEGGYEIVVGRRLNQRSSFLRRLGARLFAGIFNALSDHKVLENVSSMRIMTRRYVDYLTEFSERPFLAGLTSWIGLPVGLVDVEMRERRGSGYSIWKLIKYGLGGVIGFSTRPIRIATFSGIIVCAVSVFYGAYILGHYLLNRGATLPGFTSVATLLAFLAGTQFLFIGLLGEYIGAIFLATKNRPVFLIYDRFGFED